jgi:hypothetical protein
VALSSASQDQDDGTGAAHVQPASIFITMDYAKNDGGKSAGAQLGAHSTPPTNVEGSGLPACSPAPMEGAKAEDGGVEAADMRLGGSLPRHSPKKTAAVLGG